MVEIRNISLKSFINDILYKICFADQYVIIKYDNDIIWDSNFKILYRAKEGSRNKRDDENIDWLYKRTVYGLETNEDTIILYVE